MNDESERPTPPERPRYVRQPYPNGLDKEPTSGVFQMHTGRTRRRAVKQGVVLAAAIGMLTPLVNAVVARLSQPTPLVVVVAAPAQVKDGGP